MKPRNVELGLLLLASLITSGGYWLASVGETAEIPNNIVPFLISVLGLLLAAHVFIRKTIPFADGLLFPLAALLNGLGYMMIARLNPDLAALQALWTFIGLAAFAATVFVLKDLRWIAPYRYTLALIGVGLLLLPMLPVIGSSQNGSRIWIQLGSVSFQPGEMAKVFLAAFLASYLAEKEDLLTLDFHRIGPISLPAFKYFAPLLAAWGVTLLVMVSQRDLGTSLLFFSLFLTIIYLSTGKSVYVFTGLGLFAGAAWGAFMVFDHVKVRVDTWLNPYADITDTGHQISQTQFAIAEGGVSGTGLGLGTPNRIPVVVKDMIFAAFAEELGLMGATAILSAFLLLVCSGIKIALASSTEFEKLFAIGLIFMLGFQAFVIIGGTLRVLPLTGVTLPFVSYGGSSLVANYIVIGILMRISHNSVIAATKQYVDYRDVDVKVGQP